MLKPEQVLPAMRAFTFALGVQCNYCHVMEPTRDMSLDDKQTKPDQRARDNAKLRWLRVLRARGGPVVDVDEVGLLLLVLAWLWHGAWRKWNLSLTPARSTPASSAGMPSIS